MADVTGTRVARWRGEWVTRLRRAKLSGVIAASFSDPKNARIIFFAAGGLVVLAIALVVATVLWWRSSGIEPAALAPLEVMSSRAWMQSDDDERREQIESVRPEPTLRPGSPEAGMIVERAEQMSGVSVIAAPRPLSMPSEEPFEPFEGFAEDHFDLEPVAPAPGASAATSVGLFDQFSDSFADEADPWADARPTTRRAASSPAASDDDLWGSAPAASRRPIDPLLNDGDFW